MVKEKEPKEKVEREKTEQKEAVKDQEDQDEDDQERQFVGDNTIQQPRDKYCSVACKICTQNRFPGLVHSARGHGLGTFCATIDAAATT